MLGKYELLDRISSGGMAEICLGRLVGGGDHRFAIKRILPEVADDTQFTAMFVDEAKIASRLHHPNIARTHDFGVSDGELFIVMEYVDGVDLRTLLARCREIGVPAPRRVACRVVADLCDALSYTHAQRDSEGRPMEIVHRDVSPPNVLVDRNGTVKLIDFGVAKARYRRARTQTGLLKGKMGYLSPEQIFGAPADHRSDIFAAGVLLWELLANDRLFQGGSLEKILACEVPPPSRRNPAATAALDAIVARALARDPDDRYQDAGELRDALVEFMRRAGELCSEADQARWIETLMDMSPALAGGTPPPSRRGAATCAETTLYRRPKVTPSSAVEEKTVVLRPPKHKRQTNRYVIRRVLASPTER